MNTSQRLVRNVLLQMDTMTFFGKLQVLSYVFSVYRRRAGWKRAIKFLILGG